MIYHNNGTWTSCHAFCMKSHRPDYSQAQWLPPPRWIRPRPRPALPVSHSSCRESNSPSSYTCGPSDDCRCDACACTHHSRISYPSFHTQSHLRIPGNAGPPLLFSYDNSWLEIYQTNLPRTGISHKTRLSIFSFSDENNFSFLRSEKAKQILLTTK